MARVVDAITSSFCVKRKVFIFDTKGKVAKGDKVTYATIKNFVGKSELLSYEDGKFTGRAKEASVHGLFTIFEPLPNTDKIAIQASKFHTDEATLYCLGENAKQLLLLGNPITKCLSVDKSHIVLLPDELEGVKCFTISVIYKSSFAPIGLSKDGQMVELDFRFGETLIVCKSVVAIYFDKDTRFYRKKCTFCPVFGL